MRTNEQAPLFFSPPEDSGGGSSDVSVSTQAQGPAAVLPPQPEVSSPQTVSSQAPTSTPCRWSRFGLDKTPSRLINKEM